MSETPPARIGPPAKWVAWLCIAVFVVNYGATIIGDVIWASIVDSNPALLIALNPKNRYLALAAPVLGPVAFYGIGFVRLVAGDPASFFIGRWYGDRAIGWVRRRSRTYGPLVDDGLKLFGRLAYPIVFFAPNSYVCLISGASRMRPAVFIALNVAGTVVRLVAIRWFGIFFGSQIGTLTGWIAEYRIPILVVSALLVAVTLFRELRGGDNELAMIRDITADEDESDDSPEAQDDEPDPVPADTED